MKLVDQDYILIMLWRPGLVIISWCLRGIWNEISQNHLKGEVRQFFYRAKSPKLRVSKGKFHQKSSKLVNNYDCHSGKWRTWMWNVMEYPWTSQTARSALDLASNYAKHLGLLEMLWCQFRWCCKFTVLYFGIRQILCVLFSDHGLGLNGHLHHLHHWRAADERIRRGKTVPALLSPRN